MEKVMISFIRKIILDRIREDGQYQGVPVIKFPERNISVDGNDIVIDYGFLRRMVKASGFYLSLPPNAYGVIIKPDGTSYNMIGGFHEEPPGLYKLRFVDKQERYDITSPVSEMTLDGEKLTLKVIVRYRIINPITALEIDKPIEILIEQTETDLAQYIRSHNHNDIAESSEGHDNNKLLSFFNQRHNARFPLSKAFLILGVELKEFIGDQTFLEIRRTAKVDERNNLNEKARAKYEQDLEQMNKKHLDELDKKATEHEKEKKDILHQVQLRDIEVEDIRRRSQRQYELKTRALDARAKIYEHAVSNGRRLTPEETAAIAALDSALKEYDAEITPISSSAGNIQQPTIKSQDKVEKMMENLLNLQTSKKKQ